jgi:hypothetical protein
MRAPPASANSGVPARPEPAQLQERLEGLKELSSHSLRAEWARLFRVPPPARLSRDVLILAIGWKMQVEARGGMPASLSRRLSDLAHSFEANGDLAATRVVALRPAALMMAICVAIAFVEPLTFWVLSGTTAPAPIGSNKVSNIARLDQTRGRSRRTAAGIAAAAAIAVGTLGAPVPDASASPIAHSTEQAARSRAIGETEVISMADHLHRQGTRVSLRRLAGAIGTSKSKIE